MRVVTVGLHRGGKHIVTDFLSPYRTAACWKIVAKISERHL